MIDDSYIKFYELISSDEFLYDHENKELKFPNSDLTTALFRQNNIEYELVRNTVRVEKKNLNFAFFINKSEFFDEVAEKDLKLDILISDRKYPFYFNQHNHSIYINFQEVRNNYLISNAESFFKIQSFFKKQSEYVEGEFEFVDYYSEDTRRIVFNSITEKNRVVLEFPKAGTLQLDETIDYSSKINLFINDFETTNKHFPTFLKNALIRNLAVIPGNKFLSFYDRLDTILNTAKLNFNVYLHELSLEKIQTEYDEYKERYFNEQASILNKISNQIIALPISIAGSAFAIYKLKESLFATIFILVGVLAISCYLSFLISIYWQDLLRIVERITTDFSKLSVQPFFRENRDELVGFENTKEWLVNRASALKKSLKAFYIISWCLNICLVYFGISLIIKQYDSPQWLFFIFVTTILAIMYGFNMVFKKEKE